MRPLLLEIEGLQSYKERQVIDFEKLCKNGLFGIFGETGSGKSTILDAIIFSLYGDIPRASELAQEKNGIKNFLNTSSKTMEIYFKFALDEDIYEVKRKYALGKTKGQDELKPKEILFIKNGEIIASGAERLKKQVAEEFGLSMEDFTRTVVLPQGKFSEFVKLRGQEKRKMLENIFAMEKYGKSLQDKIKKERDFWKDREKALDEELNELSDVTPEKIEILENLKKEKQEEIEKKTQEQEELRKKFFELKTLKEEVEKYNKQLEKKRKLEEKRGEIEYKKEVLTKGKNANEIKLFIDNLERYIEEKKQIEGKLSKLETTEKTITDTIEILNREIEKVKEDILQKQKEKSKIDFDKNEEDILNEVLSRKEIIKKEEEYLEKLKKEIKLVKNEIEEKESELKAKSKDLIDKKEQESSFPEITKERLEEYRKEIDTYQKTIENYETNKKLKVLDLAKIENLNKKLGHLEEEEKTLSDEVKKLENTRRENLAYELAKDLKEGTPCPVCGSTHHKVMEYHETKNIVETENLLKDVSSKLTQNKIEIGKIIGERDNLVENLKRLEVYFDEKLIDEKIYLELIEAKEETIKKLALEEDKIEKLTSEKNRLEKEIDILKGECKNLEKEIEKSLAKLNNKLEESEEEKNTIDNHIKKLKEFGEEFLTKDILELKERKNILNLNYKKIESYEREIIKLNKKLEEDSSILANKKEEIDKVKLDIQSCQTKIDTLKDESLKLKENIKELMSKYHFVTLAEVKDSYLSEKEVNYYTEIIDKYFETLKEVEIRLNDFAERINGREFSNEIWEKTKELKEAIEEEVVSLYKLVQQIINEIEIQNSKLETSKEKKAELKEVRKNLSLSEDLYSKFSKGGFVNFLTTKKLKGIIDNASYHINKITNGRYRLYTDDDCDFYVIDMFNDGIKRKVGTLSGGEIFIVSLCLALALSKQLQLKGKIPLEFFFLDEGFGSLDSTLLDKVMEAIENIRKEENITIGIITHLEDLKIRIDKKLQVEKAISGERGTKVRIL